MIRSVDLLKGLFYLLYVSLLLSAQFGCATRDEEQLVHAASDGDVEVVRDLLLKGVDPDAAALEWTPLTRATMQGHKKVVVLLIDKGADVNIRAEGGLSPLFLAAAYNQIDIARVLIARGAAVKPYSRESGDPLTVAVSKGYYEIVELLMSAGADPSRVDYEGDSALSLAKKKGDKKLIKLLSKQ